MTKQEQIETLNQLVAEDDGVAEAIMAAVSKACTENPELAETGDLIGYWTIHLTDED